MLLIGLPNQVGLYDAAVTERHWVDWHDPYDDPNSPLSCRLRVVQQRIREALDRQPPGRVRVISVCAGQGRDLIEVLVTHPRRVDVSAVLVDVEPENVAVAEESATAAGLSGIRAVVGDASETGIYADAVPADLVLVCGVFGNISADDTGRTIAHLPTLCAPEATVIWTRHRRPPDRTPTIRAQFAAAGFAELHFDAPVEHVFTVGVHRLHGAPEPLQRGVRLFTFVGDGSRPA
jgi:hypothetical protein